MANRWLDRPLALAPQFVRRVLDARTDFEGALPVQLYPNEKLHIFSEPQAALVPAGAGNREQDALYDMINGVAVVPVRGVLVHAETWASPYLGETGYGRIEAAFQAALANPDVRAIALDIESPGGDVDGCFELAEAVYQARGEKPMFAICDPFAYSAAYALASATDQISVPATGGSGSVGVLSVHMEMSDMLKQMGVGVSVIQFGDQKSERGPFAPLSTAARQRMQDDVDVLGEMFVSLVARNRGMSKKAVKATQAATFLGGLGVEVGFADAVLSPQAAFASVVSGLKRKRIGK